MLAWFPAVAAVALIGGFAFLALRASRRRRDRVGNAWIGSDGGHGVADSGSVSLGMSDSGPGPGADPGGGGEFGGGGASGGWDDGGAGDSGGDGGGDGGGSD